MSLRASIERDIAAVNATLELVIPNDNQLPLFVESLQKGLPQMEDRKIYFWYYPEDSVGDIEMVAPEEGLLLYSDCSKEGPKSAGATVAFNFPKRQYIQRQDYFGAEDINVGEMRTIAEFASQELYQFDQPLFWHTDSLTSYKSLHSWFQKGHSHFARSSEVGREMDFYARQVVEAINNYGHPVMFYWSHSHQNLAGNNMADFLAQRMLRDQREKSITRSFVI